MNIENVEQISLWDRWFNRYRKVILEQGSEPWIDYPYGKAHPEYGVRFARNFVKYKVIDRVTGSERIEIEYLN